MSDISSVEFYSYNDVCHSVAGELLGPCPSLPGLLSWWTKTNDLHFLSWAKDRNPSHVRLGPPFIGQGDTTDGGFACSTPMSLHVAAGESWHQEDEPGQLALELSCMRLRATVVRGHCVQSCQAFSSVLNAPGSPPGSMCQVAFMPFPGPFTSLARRSPPRRSTPGSRALTVGLPLTASFPGQKGEAHSRAGQSCCGNLVPVGIAMDALVPGRDPRNLARGEGFPPCALQPASSTRRRSCRFWRSCGTLPLLRGLSSGGCDEDCLLP
jgi:hypothetical protein